MAACDYRSCDVCGGKAFYDASLSYNVVQNDGDAYRIAGRDQYDTPELVKEYGYALGYVGDWAVICTECAKTHRCIIEKKETP